MSQQEFKLPEIGEGVIEGEIVEWHIEAGGAISKDQVAVSVLTDKATVEIACPLNGTLAVILKKSGETINVGEPLALVEDGVQEKEPRNEPPSVSHEKKDLEKGITAFVLPEIGEGVMEGELLQWFVSEGDPIVKDQNLFSILTDKATLEITSPFNGHVSNIKIAPGDTVMVGKEVMSIETSDIKPGNMVKPVEFLSPKEESSVPVSTRSDTIPLASPAVRKKARELGFLLTDIQGTGKNNRITMPDLIHFSKHKKLAIPIPEKVEPVPESTSPGKREPIKGLRKAIFTTMTLAKRMVPHFTYVEEVEMDALMAMRSDLQQDASDKGVSLSFLPFIVVAVTKALVKFPMINVSVDETRHDIVFHPEIHLGIATSTPRGLMVPVVKHTTRKSLFQLSAEIAELSTKARTLKAGLEDLSGSTFTITSLGKLGGLLATPIINYPEAGILGIHEIKERAVVRNGHITIRKMMNLAGSFDHRIIDGDVGAAFIQEVRTLLEHPARLLV
jgi:pyruvate/2-oxoglutarate dehydrogenase complex dihydrolipoamide acyltransferase (E2) component